MKYLPLTLLAVFLVATPSLADSVTITSNRDTSIYKGFPNNSNGGGVGMFAGNDNNSNTSRGLIGFDVVGNLPAGAIVQSVELTLNLGQVAGAGSSGSGAGGDPTPRTISLVALSANWGEGTAGSGTTTIPGTGSGFAAGSGDATWNARSYSASSPVPWTNPGGDFSAIASGSAVVGNPSSVPTPFSWTSTAAMVSDVQSWLNNPAANFGWLLTNSNEASPKTSRAFYTHEATNAALRPALHIVFVVPEPATLKSLGLGILGFGAVVYRRRRRF